MTSDIRYTFANSVKPDERAPYELLLHDFNRLLN